AVSTKNIYICDDGRVLLDNFSHCISLISDGKLRRQIYDFDDDLKDEILYLAPEIIFQSADGYNMKSDIYSLGITACELANGTHSYANLDYTNILLIKVQGVQPYLLDQTQLSTEILEQPDKHNEPFINEIKKRRYSKDFHSFVSCCVATHLNYRCSVDELQTHSFMKQAKKMSNDLHHFVDEITKITGSQLEQQRSQNNDNIQLIGDIFGNMDHSNKEHTPTWEF
ncbi:unnamed protein product, partial [Didymodactylos carnosus]